MFKLSGSVVKEVFLDIDSMFDLDGSGSIDANELALVFQSMGQGNSPDEIQKLIEAVDLNKSGVIEWPEFLLVAFHLYCSFIILAHAHLLSSEDDPTREGLLFACDDFPWYLIGISLC